MYAIIYWEKTDKVHFITNMDGSVMTFKAVEDADAIANAYDEEFSKGNGSLGARVISLDGVHE